MNLFFHQANQDIRQRFRIPASEHPVYVDGCLANHVGSCHLQLSGYFIFFVCYSRSILTSINRMYQSNAYSTPLPGVRGSQRTGPHSFYGLHRNFTSPESPGSLTAVTRSKRKSLDTVHCHGAQGACPASKLMVSARSHCRGSLGAPLLSLGWMAFVIR